MNATIRITEPLPIVRGAKEPLWVQTAFIGVEVEPETIIEKGGTLICIKKTKEYHIVSFQKIADVLKRRAPQALSWLREHGIDSSIYIAVPLEYCEPAVVLAFGM